MPLDFSAKYNNDVAVSIWRLEEELDYFRSSMYLYEDELDEIDGLSERKLMEWYASRYLLYRMSGWDYRGPCLKDKHGKPYLEGSPLNISLSHSHDRIAAAVGPRQIGVDIQFIVKKITRIAPKFSSEKELQFVQGEHYILGYHFIWGAKESIYKAYGKRNIDFKKDIAIEPFSVNREIETTAALTLEDSRMYFYIHAKQLDDYVLVLATHIPG